MVDEKSAVCNSIANFNCSIYSYHSVARFGSALHQKHWHWKHLRWAPEQRRAPKAPFSASTPNAPRGPCTGDRYTDSDTAANRVCVIDPIDREQPTYAHTEQ